MELNQFKDLFEDIYLFLKKDDDESKNLNTEHDHIRCNLMQRCRNVLLQINSDIVDDNNSYLDMCASKNLLQGDTDDEYMIFNNSNTMETENDNDIYDNCATTSTIINNNNIKQIISVSPLLTNEINDMDKIKENNNCPFSGLPAAHLLIKKSIKIGILYRIEKRLFFDQTKKYYCGILDKWLLMYSGGSNDLKPSNFLYLNNCDVEIINEIKKKEFMFQITIDNIKKYYFQVNTINDLNEWINCISDAKKQYDIQENINIKNGILSNLRKLPTPPLNNYNSNIINNSNNNRNSNRSENIDDIYEEPNQLINERKLDENQLKNNVENNSNYINDENILNENPYDNVVQFTNITPTDTIIIGNKMIKIINGMRIEYDIPKNIPINQHQKYQINDEHEQQIQDNNDNDDNDDDSKNYELIQQTTIKTEEKIINPIMNKLNIKQKKIISTTNTNNTETVIPVNRTPVKQWLFNRLNRTSSTASTSTEKSKTTKILQDNKIKATIKSPKKSIKNLELNDINLPETIKVSLVNEKTPPKGSKINMIINQLEANGHLPLISKNFNERRHTMMQELDENYDLVSHNNK